MQQEKSHKSDLSSPFVDQETGKKAEVPSTLSIEQEFLPVLWYLLADRIAPQLCCRYPPPLEQIFKAAVREVSYNDGDLDKAVTLLREIFRNASAEEMIFEQAGQLLNIIEWRRTYHPSWFVQGCKGRRLKPGKCSAYISHAMVLLQTGSDDEALDLTQKILDSSEPESDDEYLAYLIRTAVFICKGEISHGEAEFAYIISKSLTN
ncbi:hypothetical protein [Methanospirillum lacunae]|uniref:Uncharacterized protein n=1 Tax=Methanospirillum lacunae TaxID=668570 RepID=A0A2V2NAY3_9EURY|nr:hypothetical protein [Methanospirillum lacunae]PWR72721.1 hypothetical protein DK846_07155 [Methanospirillum lacunae]